MTKNVRIENADSGTHYQVLVEVWTIHYETKEPVMVESKILSHPTMLDTFMIHEGRWLVVKELHN
jgi:hypothetical protein